MYTITFFAVQLFQQMGLGNVLLVTIGVALSRVLGNILSSALIHRFGRRTPYTISSAASCLCMGFIGAVMVMSDSGVLLTESITSWMLVILIFTFMFFIGVSISSLPWVLMAEWFPTELKSIVSSTVIPASFGSIFLSAKLSDLLLSFLGPSGLFVYFSSVCGLHTVFVTLMVPETHGLLYSHRNILDKIGTSQA